MSQKTKCWKDYNVKDKQINVEFYHATCTFVCLNQTKPNKRALPLIVQIIPTKEKIHSVRHSHARFNDVTKPHTDPEMTAIL